MDGSGDASALLGMDGSVVLATIKDQGELHVLVEAKGDRTGWPSCGVVASGRGRSVVQVRDLANGGAACPPRLAEAPVDLAVHRL